MNNKKDFLQIISRMATSELIGALDKTAVFCSARDGDVDFKKTISVQIPTENAEYIEIEKYFEAVVRPAMLTMAYEFQEMRKRIIKTYLPEIPKVGEHYRISIDGLNAIFSYYIVPKTVEKMIIMSVLV